MAATTATIPVSDFDAPAASAARGCLRSRLVESGLALFTERPFSEVSLADVARAAGVSDVEMERHFATKQDLYLAAVQAEIGRAHV